MPMVLKAIEEMITEENKKKYGDKLFDLVEDFVADTETKVDDTVVLPLVKAARTALDIPDND